MRWLRVLLVAMVPAIVLVWAGYPAQGATPPYLKYLSSQIPDARKAASRAQAALKSTSTQVRLAGSTLEGATGQLDRALQQKEAVEARIFESLPEDARLPKAWNLYAQAREDLQGATERALSGPEYQRAFAEIKDTTGAGDALADLRAETLAADSAVRSAAARLRIAKREFEEARRETLDNEPQWAAATFAVQSARKEVKEAEAFLDYALTRRFVAGVAYNQAALAVARREAAKQELASRKKTGGKSKKNGKSKNKKNNKSKSGSKKSLSKAKKK